MAVETSIFDRVDRYSLADLSSDSLVHYKSHTMYSMKHSSLCTPAYLALGTGAKHEPTEVEIKTKKTNKFTNDSNK